MSDHENALKLPAGVTPGDGAQEMLRFWIANNVPASQLFVGGAESAREPGMWGFILADIAKHVIQTLRAHDPAGPDAQALLEQIMANFIERLKHDPELAGVVTRTES